MKVVRREFKEIHRQKKQIFHKRLRDRWRDSRSSLAMTSLALCLRHAVSAYTLPSGGCGYMKSSTTASVLTLWFVMPETRPSTEQ